MRCFPAPLTDRCHAISRAVYLTSRELPKRAHRATGYRPASLILLGFRLPLIAFVVLCRGFFWCETGAVLRPSVEWAVVTGDTGSSSRRRCRASGVAIRHQPAWLAIRFCRSLTLSILPSEVSGNSVTM